MPPRVLFPKTGFTTSDLADAYAQLAPVLLPHLARRPLTLKRFPDDINGEAFWEKDAPSFAPPFIQRFPVPRKSEEGVINYINLANRRSLEWAALTGCVEIHAFLHRYPFISSPTLIAFDLDPGAGVTLTDCCAVALEIRTWFDRYKLRCFPKVSGSKGLQVYVPLNTPSSYAITQALSRRVAEELERRNRNAVISRMARADRVGKVFVDWSQNAEHKTTVSVYSVRAKQEEPFVSMPITWREVETAVKKRDIRPLLFSPADAIARTKQVGDLFAPVLTLEQNIPEILYAELGLPHAPNPQPVVIPEITTATYRPPRSSGQGGRKLFVIHRRGPQYELGVEVNGEFLLFVFGKFPTSFAAGGVSGAQSGTRDLTYLTHESGENGIVWDLGTYELIEGSFNRGLLDLYLSGRRLDGEWMLERTHEAWRLKSKSGRVKRVLPATASALSGVPTTADIGGRRNKRGT